MCARTRVHVCAHMYQFHVGFLDLRGGRTHVDFEHAIQPSRPRRRLRICRCARRARRRRGRARGTKRPCAARRREGVGVVFRSGRSVVFPRKFGGGGGSGVEGLAVLGEAMVCRPTDIPRHIVKHTASHCITLQHTATHCNTLQHRNTGIPRHIVQHTASHCITLQHTATHCNTLQHTATHCNTGIPVFLVPLGLVPVCVVPPAIARGGGGIRRVFATAERAKCMLARIYNTLQRTATRRLQHTAAYYNMAAHAGCSPPLSVRSVCQCAFMCARVMACERWLVREDALTCAETGS